MAAAILVLGVEDQAIVHEAETKSALGQMYLDGWWLGQKGTRQPDSHLSAVITMHVPS